MSNLRMTRLVVALVVATASSAAFAGQTLDSLLPPRVEPVYRALDEAFEPGVAMETVTYMQQFWRIAGNPGFNSSIDFIRTRLAEGGVHATIAEFKGEGHGWAPVSLTLGTFKGDEFRVSLAINSFSTAGDVRLPLIDVGEGTRDADYEGKAVKGALVLASARARSVWEHAVVTRGAAGIVSSYVPAYNRPADTPGIVTWESVPYDAGRRAFAIKVSRETAARLKEHAASGERIRVNVQTVFHELPTRTLIAEIPGRTRPDERIVMVAHVQEPGANDDASGCGTLLGMARALARGITAGRIPPPERTLTFLWVDEIRGSEQWLKEDPGRAGKVQYMFSLDMTGEDTTKTGGTFLIEKQPDPSAVWARPSDPHSEWGAGEVKRESLKGSLLNDVHLAICLRRARDTGWVVRTNPYEGGSDHTVFGRYGIPSLLDWHFTDRYYHTNMDTADKTSPQEMKNVGVAVATSAWLLASANAEDATSIARLVETAARERFALEERNRRELLAAGKSNEETERQVIAAWKKWYGEARESVQKLPIPNSQIPRR